MNRWFQALACAAAGIWLGGMILMAIVAQTTFSVIRTTDVERPNAVAGRVMATNFKRFDVVQIVCAATVAAWAMSRLLRRTRRRRDGIRAGLVIAACGILAYNAGVMTPRIESMQGDVAGADADARVKAAFDSYHATAVRLAQANLMLVLALTLEIAVFRGGREPQT